MVLPGDASNAQPADDTPVRVSGFAISEAASPKKTLAEQICEELHHEAEVEHVGAKKLIAEIEGAGPDDEYFDARVKVLSEMVKHHVKEDEKPGGMFAEARKADVDLDALGQRMKARKEQLADKVRKLDA